jgi:predicted CoA-binding protein
MEAASIKQFFAQKRFAVVGVSRSGTGFGNMVFSELRQRGLSVFQVNPQADEIAGEPCYRSLTDVPESVDAVIVTVSSENVLSVVEQAYEAGVRNIWLQRGIESPEALRFAEQRNVNMISERCVMMFAEPVSSIHRFHRGLAKLFNRYPREATA